MNQETFTFDLERMRKAVDAPSHIIPDTINTFEEFDAWLNALPVNNLPQNS